MSNLTEKAFEAGNPGDLAGLEYQPPETLRPRFVVSLVILYLGVYVAAVGLSIVAWPLTVARLDPAEKVFWLSLVTGLYAVLNVVVTPIAGILSDRCTSRLGMRRPFIMVGILFSLVGFAVMAFSGNIAQLMLGVVFQGLGNATVTGGAGAIVPDQVPERHRGRVQGLLLLCISVSGVLASVFFPQLAANQLALYLAPAALMLIAGVIVSVILKDRHLSRAERARVQRPANIFKEFRIRPSTIPDYSWAWISKVAVVLGTVLTSTYGVYVLTDQIRISPASLPNVLTLTSLLGLGTTILGAVLGSYISDKLRIRKSLVLYTSLIIAVGAVVVAFSHSLPMYVAGLLILGLGAGAYTPIDGAVFIDVLPGQGKDSGKFLSLMTVADQLPRSFGPIIGSLLVSAGTLVAALGGYTLVYLAGAVAAVAGGLLVRKIKGSI